MLETVTAESQALGLYLTESRRKKLQNISYFFAKLRNNWKKDSTTAAKFQGIRRNLSPLELAL